MEKEDPVMKMYEAQAEAIMVRNELEQTKKELEKVKQQRDELQRMLLQQNRAAQPGSSSDNSGSILGLEFKGMSRYGQQKKAIVLVQDMQTVLADISKKLDKNHEDMKKRVDSSLRQVKLEQPPKLGNNPKKGGKNKQDNWNPESCPRPNPTETILVFRSDEVFMLDYNNNLWNTFKLPNVKVVQETYFMALGLAENCRAVVYLNGEIYFITSTIILHTIERSINERQNSPPTTLPAITTDIAPFMSSEDRAKQNHYYPYPSRHFYQHQGATNATHFSHKNGLRKIAADFTRVDLAPMEYTHFDISRSCVAYNNCIVIIGGTILDECGKLQVTNIVEKYDPTTDSWAKMPLLNFPRKDASAIVIGQKIYVCGGHQKVECFDPESQQWIAICSLPLLRSHLAIAPDGHNFIVFGGNGVAYTDVWKIILDNGTARCTGIKRLPEGRGYFSAIGYGNTILAIGGTMAAKVKKTSYPYSNRGGGGPIYTTDAMPTAPRQPNPQAYYCQMPPAYQSPMASIDRTPQQPTVSTNSVLQFNGKWWSEGPPLPVAVGNYYSVIIPLELGHKLVNKFG